MHSKLVGIVMLTLAALIWGTAFVAQSVGMRHVEPFTFNAVRFLIGGLVLLPMLCRRHGGGTAKGDSALRRDWRAAFFCGILLCVTLSFQQMGLLYTSVGKAGFITALYVVLVPVMGIFLGRRAAAYLWGCITTAIVGMYLLCINEELSLNRGDVYVFVCALSSAAHILLVDRVVARVDGVWLSCTQFMVCSFLSAVLALVFEKPEGQAILACSGPLLYTGILSCGVAYTFQILGQKSTGPVLAALILSLESVFAALAGWLVLHETLSAKEIFGCALIFSAILAAQLPALFASRPKI